MSSQELPSSPKSPARTYASKKRGEKPAAKAKRKANSDDDTRDSAEDPAVVKETPQKEEGYGTEPDRESPAKREGSPDLDSEPLNVRIACRLCARLRLSRPQRARRRLCH